jgi:hypothetical protein
MTRPSGVTIAFAGALVRIEHHGRRPARIVRFLFRDAARSRTRSPDSTFVLSDSPTEDGLRLDRDGASRYQGNSDAAAAATLLEAVLYDLADYSRGGLVFHAAAVVRDGRTMLLPGQTGAGKTTLTSWLLSKGLRYQSDELAFIASGSLAVSGLPRPLNVKRQATGILETELGVDTLVPDVMRTPAASLVPVRLLSPEGPAGPAELGEIVFPRHDARATFGLTRLSPAQAGLRLMGCLINARNLDMHGFPEVTRLVRERPAYDLSYGSFDQLGEWIG